MSSPNHRIEGHDRIVNTLITYKPSGTAITGQKLPMLNKTFTWFS